MRGRTLRLSIAVLEAALAEAMAVIPLRDIGRIDTGHVSGGGRCSVTADAVKVREGVKGGRMHVLCTPEKAVVQQGVSFARPRSTGKGEREANRPDVMSGGVHQARIVTSACLIHRCARIISALRFRRTLIVPYTVEILLEYRAPDRKASLVPIGSVIPLRPPKPDRRSARSIAASWYAS